MSAKHTPGPWVRFKVEINGSVHYDVLPAMRHGVIASWISEPDSILIAAAPEQQAKIDALSDALESVFRECEANDVPTDCVNDDPERCDDKDCWPCRARAALTLAGRRPNP